ncbi:MAG: DEAD/DEAH box helicase family protein [Planctomycetales bacterium]|nr:DEAD/DEAH box helicase family protein [Planctomycetales bacterium]
MLPGSVNDRSSPNEKIALFRSLFRGREDVYPRRFESRTTGKTGYSPVCSNEWVSGVCEKPRVKCANCQHRSFLPVTDDVIRCHLTGKDELGNDFVAGVYPMLLDETCFFLTIDLDKANWQDDAIAVLETCRQIDVPAALERSRSGNGGHIWIFFETAIPASIARRLGSHVLTETMERRPDLGLDSYDRFFPNQDTLPRGGFGNLIALPLQKRPRDCGNSVFVDEDFTPFDDQWALLSSIQRMSLVGIEELVNRASKNGRVIGLQAPVMDDEGQPWSMAPSRKTVDLIPAGELPTNLELTLGDQVYIPKADLPPALRNCLIRLAAFQNPEFYKAQSMRLPTWGKPRIISCAENYDNHLALPRGCLADVQSLLDELKIEASIRDERVSGSAIDVAFHGELRPEQKSATRNLLCHDTGVLSATTAFGKTVVAIWMLAERGVNTLVLVHRKQLLDQWVHRLSEFLGISPKSIGRAGGGRKKLTGQIDVAIIQSLVHKGLVKDCVADYGHLIIDECHHLSAQSFELVARRTKARYILGLSATVNRKDGHHPIIFMQCGPVRHRVDAKSEAIARPFKHSVVVRPTAFRPVSEANDDQRIQFQDLYRELIHDHDRNRMICEDVIQSIRDDRSPLVLTERKDHLDEFATRLEKHIRHVVVLKGGAGIKESRAIARRLSEIKPDEDRVLLATGRYIGEGFDDPRLDTLFLTLPVSWRGTIAQYVGRLHRLHEGKTEVRVYDYADLNVPMLSRMFDRRCAGYESVGYTVLLPGSAVAGWPTEIPLPVDPQWKRDYAATVRRLVRDGVDAPLAKLFVHVAREFDSNAQGLNRARSASEAFLFRRLESLPETVGRFALNQELPIPFDGWGNMEVDLIDTEARLVIELDGGQHFSNRDAYRRDRRKDALLQEYGYFVLRFLVEDIGKRLDQALDAILRVIDQRSRFGK